MFVSNAAGRRCLPPRRCVAEALRPQRVGHGLAARRDGSAAQATPQRPCMSRHYPRDEARPTMRPRSGHVTARARMWGECVRVLGAALCACPARRRRAAMCVEDRAYKSNYDRRFRVSWKAVRGEVEGAAATLDTKSQIRESEGWLLR